MKVLSIGNRMSSDAHAFLPHLAKAAGKELLLSNLCTENASLQEHYENFIDENEVYFYETYLPGETVMMRPDGIALHEAVEEEEWDIITLQQCGTLSGDEGTYNPWLAELAAYCRMMHPGAKIMLVQAWAFEKGCPLPEFRELYGKEQDTMYEMITESCKKAPEAAEIEHIIPVGKVFQVIRHTDIGDRLTCDGCFANEPGQFAAACTMY